MTRPAAILGGAADRALDLTVVPGFSRIGLLARRRLPGWPADPAPNALAGKHIAVTGATSGLGLQTAIDALDLGAVVHFVVRDEPKATRAVDTLVARATLDERDDIRSRCRIWACDMSDLDSLRACVTVLSTAAAQEGWRLHGLVHNAGSMPPTRTESPQGHELTMAIHVLGPVLFTDLLAASDQLPDRIVLVTSGGMYTQSVPADDPNYQQGQYRPAVAYARSKRTQVDLLPRLARRWAPAHVWAMHPGWAATPGVTESLPGFEKLTRPILRTAAEGADTTIWLLATEPPPTTGTLWHDRQARPTHRLPGTRASESELDGIEAWVNSAVT